MSEREEKFKNMVKFKKLVASGCMIYEHDNLDYAIAETYSYSEDDPDYGSLFAAAPEMRDALKDCLEDLNDVIIQHDVQDWLEESIKNSIKKAEQALKKARGEE